MASLPGYAYSTSDKGVWVHLYHNSSLDWHLPDGRALEISQQTRYPWDEVVDLTVTPRTPAEFSLFLRIPAWSAQTDVQVNGRPASAAPQADQYLDIRQPWT